MLRRVPAQAQQRQRRSQIQSFPAPTGGWTANQNLALPNAPINGVEQQPGAVLLENFFPTATSVLMRRGCRRHATLGAGTETVRSMFTYIVGGLELFFAATDTAIYNVTAPPSPYNYVLGTDEGDIIITDDEDDIGTTSIPNSDIPVVTTGGDWVVTQFATSGGVYLVGVNGADDGFIFDGLNFYPMIDGGIHELPYTDLTDPFVVGELVTGGTSGATGVVWRVDAADPTTGSLFIRNLTGTFQTAENLTGDEDGVAKVGGEEIPVIPGFDGITSDKLSYVWVYKNRLFFVEAGTMNAWYLEPDSIGGTATELPLGGIFTLGGALLFGSAWSLDTGYSGGLSDQCIFVSTEGQVAVFQGDDPSEADQWARVGVYRIGKPLGHKAHIRAGSDIIIATTIGFLPLSQAIQRDYAALSPVAVSYPIESAWSTAITQRGIVDWRCHVWAEGQMVLISPPLPSDGVGELFVANARTGAWCVFRGWNARSMTSFAGRFFFGSEAGAVIEGNTTGADEGTPYVGRYVALFEDMDSPASLKISKMARVVIRSLTEVNELVTAHYDFDVTPPPAPDASPSPVGSLWGIGVWGESVWSSGTVSYLTERWNSVNGIGYTIAPGVQITSGGIAPIDAEIIRTDVTYTVADIVT